MKKLFLITCALCASAFAGEVGELKTLANGDGITKYSCEPPKGDAVKVSLTTTGAMPILEVDVAKIQKSRGYATENYDAKEKVVYYNMTSGGYPQHLEYSLGKFADGKVRLTLAWGAYEMVCETK